MILTMVGGVKCDGNEKEIENDVEGDNTLCGAPVKGASAFHMIYGVMPILPIKLLLTWQLATVPDGYVNTTTESVLSLKRFIAYDVTSKILHISCHLTTMNPHRHVRIHHSAQM